MASSFFVCADCGTGLSDRPYGTTLLSYLGRDLLLCPPCVVERNDDSLAVGDDDAVRRITGTGERHYVTAGDLLREGAYLEDVRGMSAKMLWGSTFVHGDVAVTSAGRLVLDVEDEYVHGDDADDLMLTDRKEVAAVRRMLAEAAS